jgi:hypothetical protein
VLLAPLLLVALGRLELLLGAAPLGIRLGGDSFARSRASPCDDEAGDEQRNRYRDEDDHREHLFTLTRTTRVG